MLRWFTLCFQCEVEYETRKVSREPVNPVRFISKQKIDQYSFEAGKRLYSVLWFCGQVYACGVWRSLWLWVFLRSDTGPPWWTVLSNVEVSEMWGVNAKWRAKPIDHVVGEDPGSNVILSPRPLETSLSIARENGKIVTWSVPRGFGYGRVMRPARTSMMAFFFYFYNVSRRSLSWGWGIDKWGRVRKGRG